jgi:hypothetical protein
MKRRHQEDMSEEEEKPTPEQSLKGIKWLILAIGIMGAVGLGMMFFYNQGKNIPSEENAYSYNFFQFSRVDGIWVTEAQSGRDLYQILARYGPKDVENIPVKGDIRAVLDKWGFFYISFDPGKEEQSYVAMANAEISTKLVAHFAKGLQTACNVDHPECERLSLVKANCDNSTLPVIFLKNDPGASIEVNGNCIVIQGEGEELVKAADRFVYSMYGIMK